MTYTQLAAPTRRRIQLLLFIGIALLASGVSAAYAILSSRLGRYMYIEDLELGLDESTMFNITKFTPADKGLLLVSGVLALLGVIALVAAIIRSLVARRRIRLNPPG